MAGLTEQIRERLQNSKGERGIFPKTSSLLSLPSNLLPEGLQKGETLNLNVKATVKSIGKNSVAVTVDSADLIGRPSSSVEENLPSEILSSLKGQQQTTPQGGNV